jgi:hypothetical protein
MQASKYTAESPCPLMQSCAYRHPHWYKYKDVCGLQGWHVGTLLLLAHSLGHGCLRVGISLVGMLLH